MSQVDKTKSHVVFNQDDENDFGKGWHLEMWGRVSVPYVSRDAVFNAIEADQIEWSQE